MKVSKLAAAWLVAACALVAVAAATAQADTPQFYTKAAIGSPAPAQRFNDSSSILYYEGATSRVKIECKRTTGTGEVTGATSANHIVSDFKECELPSLHYSCENKGASTKEIETLPIKGELGEYTSTEGGIKLSPESGPYLTEYECANGGVLIKWKGSLVGSIVGSGPTVQESKIASSLTLSFLQSKGIQKIKNLVGGTPEQLAFVVSEYNGSGYTNHEELLGINEVMNLTDATDPTDDNIGVSK